MRRGGQGKAQSNVYRPEGGRVLVALVAFGGLGWMSRGARAARRDFDR